MKNQSFTLFCFAFFLVSCRQLFISSIVLNQPVFTICFAGAKVDIIFIGATF